MSKKSKGISCCSSMEQIGGCEVESVVTVDERGQMVLPKEVRDKANIKAGDKLTIISWKKEGRICCISLIKAQDFAQMVKGILGPMFRKMDNTGGGK